MWQSDQGANTFPMPGQCKKERKVDIYFQSFHMKRSMEFFSTKEKCTIKSKILHTSTKTGVVGIDLRHIWHIAMILFKLDSLHIGLFLRNTS